MRQKAKKHSRVVKKSMNPEYEEYVAADDSGAYRRYDGVYDHESPPEEEETFMNDGRFNEPGRARADDTEEMDHPDAQTTGDGIEDEPKAGRRASRK